MVMNDESGCILKKQHLIFNSVIEYSTDTKGNHDNLLSGQYICSRCSREHTVKYKSGTPPLTRRCWRRVF
jgi:hypothetical protein